MIADKTTTIKLTKTLNFNFVIYIREDPHISAFSVFHLKINEENADNTDVTDDHGYFKKSSMNQSA